MPAGPAAACFAFLLTLGSWTLPTTTSLNDLNTTFFTARNVSATTAGALVELDYSSRRTNLTFVHPSEVIVDAVLDINVTAILEQLHLFQSAPAEPRPPAGPSVSNASHPNTTTAPPAVTTTTAPTRPAAGMLYNVPATIGLVTSAGHAIVDTATSADSCLPSSATLSSCTVVTKADVKLKGDLDVELIQDFIKLLLESLSNSTCSFATTAVEDIGALARNGTDAPKPLPAPPAGSCDLNANKLTRMIANVASGLPTLFGLSIGLSIVSPAAFHASIAFDDFAVDPIPLGPTDWVFLPPGTQLEFDLWTGAAKCPQSNAITLVDDLRIMNLRVHNRLRNDADVIFNDFIADGIASSLTFAIFLALALDGGNRTITLPTHDGTTAPLWVMACVTAGTLCIGLMAAVASYLAHRNKVVLDKHHNEVSRCRRITGDAIIILGCCTGIIMFAWSNQTSAAWVKIGGELNLYQFSLGNSIRDMWDAGLYVLATFIAVFCGFYPYFKLLSVLLFSVVLQRPQSVVLQLIDVLGKFSFLDAFVMIIMAEGLAVPGIAEVHMGTSFWVFVGATCLSIALGNYATHGVRIDASVSQHHTLQTTDDFNDGRHHPILNHGSLYLDDFSPEPRRRSVFGLDPRSPRRFRPIAAGIAFVLITGCITVAMTVDTITYDMSGLGSLVTGTHNPYTLWRLLSKAPLPLAILAMATAVVAPCLFALGFARTRILAAWVTTDVLTFACIAGLLQLKQFTQFVLGDSFAGFITITATLNWPIYALGAASILSLVLTGWSVLLRR